MKKKISLKHTTIGGDMLHKWWPNRLNLKILQQNNEKLVPLKDDYSYKKSFAKLDYKALKDDLRKIMRESKEL